MKKLFIFFICFLCSCAFSLSSQPNGLQSQQINNLGFSNQTGPGVRGDELKNFMLFVSVGSNQFKDDTKGILGYIRNSMNNFYGNQSKVYDIMLMTSTSYVNFELWPVFGEYATISTGVDYLHSSYSYGFASHFKNPKQNLVQNYIETVNTKGKGIDSSKEEKIKKLIQQTENGGDCGKGLQLGLTYLDKQNWSVICTCYSSPNLILFIYAYDDQWVFLKPKDCYYGLWVVGKNG